MSFELAIQAALAILDTPEADGGLSDDQKILHASLVLRTPSVVASVLSEVLTPGTPPVVSAPDATVTATAISVAPVSTVVPDVTV